MNNELVLPDRIKRELAKRFKLDPNTIRRALLSESNSPRANMLRAAALQEGALPFTGKVVDKVTYKESVIK